MKIVKTVLALAIFFEMQACENRESSNLLSEKVGVANDYKYPLGSGFVSKTDTILTSACISAADRPSALAVIPYPHGDLKGGFSESRSTVIDKFNMTVSASVDAGLKGSGAANIDTTFAESDLKTASYLSFTYRAGNVYLREPQLSFLGKGMLLGTEQRTKIISQCGDEFVYRVDLGARFHVGIEYTFASKEFKNEMKAQLKVTGPAGVKLFDINESSALPTVDKSIGTMNLVVFQEGGDQKAFQTMSDGIPKNCLLKIDKDGKLVRSAFESCTIYYQEKILPYAKAQLPQQIGKLDYSAMSQLNVLTYYMRRYDEFGFPELQRDIELSMEARSYRKKVLAPFESELFQLMSFKRSIVLGVGGNPEIGAPAGVKLSPKDFIDIRNGLEMLESTGRLGLNRCKDLMNQYITDPEIPRASIQTYLSPCTTNRTNFLKDRDGFIASAVFPAVYRPYFK